MITCRICRAWIGAAWSTLDADGEPIQVCWNCVALARAITLAETALIYCDEA